MLECLVFGRRAAENIKENFRAAKDSIAVCDNTDASVAIDEGNINQKIEFVRSTVTKYAGPVRTPEGMAEGKRIIDELFEKEQSVKLTKEIDFYYYNMLSCAKMILDGAIARKESIGAHYIVED